MSLNVKDPEARRIAAMISQMTGETMTKVVISALKEKWEKLPGHKRDPEKIRKDLLAIAERASADGQPYSDHDFLYDDSGLPK